MFLWFLMNIIACLYICIFGGAPQVQKHTGGGQTPVPLNKFTEKHYLFVPPWVVQDFFHHQY